MRGQLGIDNGFSAYVAAKGALDALARRQATEWAKPGSPSTRSHRPSSPRRRPRPSLADETLRAVLEQRIPLHRIADTDDVVGASLLLCSDAASFVTGQILTLDGGLTACSERPSPAAGLAAPGRGQDAGR